MTNDFKAIVGTMSAEMKQQLKDIKEGGMSIDEIGEKFLEIYNSPAVSKTPEEPPGYMRTKVTMMMLLSNLHTGPGGRKWNVHIVNIGQPNPTKKGSKIANLAVIGWLTEGQNGSPLEKEKQAGRVILMGKATEEIEDLSCGSTYEVSLSGNFNEETKMLEMFSIEKELNDPKTTIFKSISTPPELAENLAVINLLDKMFLPSTTLAMGDHIGAPPVVVMASLNAIGRPKVVNEAGYTMQSVRLMDFSNADKVEDEELRNNFWLDIPPGFVQSTKNSIMKALVQCGVRTRKDTNEDVANHRIVMLVEYVSSRGNGDVETENLTDADVDIDGHGDDDAVELPTQENTDGDFLFG